MRYFQKRLYKQSATIIFVLGALSKILATVLTYPYIVAQSRLSVVGTGRTSEPKQYSGTLDVIIKILKLEGVVGLYQGLESKLLQSVLNASFLFLLHHKFVSVLVRIISERKIKPSSH